METNCPALCCSNYPAKQEQVPDCQTFSQTFPCGGEIESLNKSLCAYHPDSPLVQQLVKIKLHMYKKQDLFSIIERESQTFSLPRSILYEKEYEICTTAASSMLHVIVTVCWIKIRFFDPSKFLISAV